LTVRVGFRLVNPAGWTGGVNYLLNVCRILLAHEPEFQPVLFAPPGVDAALSATIASALGGPAVTLRDRSHRDDLAALVGVPELASDAAFRAAKIDLVFESTGYYGPRPRLPMLSWLQDFQHRQLPQYFSSRQWLTREIRYRSLISNRPHLLLSSRDALADMQRIYPVPNGTVHVAPFAICMTNPPSFADGERVRLAYGLPDRFLFLPNQFWAHKNHQVVVDALGLMAPADRPVIAASGSPNDPRAPRLMQRLLDRLAANGSRSNFLVLGHIPYADVMALNARADALLNPSLFEGWSTPVEEAKSLGTPLILSDLAVHREQVGDGAIFFNPTSADDCAAALSAAMASRPRVADDHATVIARNQEAQVRFAGELRAAFEATLAGRHR
jgi:glycosyltransferase involved in cell wall biosynthesis